MLDVLMEICNRTWRKGEWPTPWTQSLIKKGNLQLCQYYRTICLISHSAKSCWQSSWIGLTASWRDNCWRTGWIHSRREHHRTDLQPQNQVWKVPPTSEDPCFYWFNNGLWHSMACNLMGHQAKVPYQCKSSSHHWVTLRQGYKCSPDEWQPGRMVQNNRRRKVRMSFVTHPLKTFYSNRSFLVPWNNML